MTDHPEEIASPACGLLPSLRSIFAARAFSSFDAQCVQSSTDDVITNTRQIAHPSAADQHDAVFLKIVLFARNIRRDLPAIAEPHTGDFPQSRIRLLGRHGFDLK